MGKSASTVGTVSLILGYPGASYGGARRTAPQPREPVPAVALEPEHQVVLPGTQHPRLDQVVEGGPGVHVPPDFANLLRLLRIQTEGRLHAPYGHEMERGGLRRPGVREPAAGDVVEDPEQRDAQLFQRNQR